MGPRPRRGTGPRQTHLRLSRPKINLPALQSWLIDLSDNYVQVQSSSGLYAPLIRATMLDLWDKAILGVMQAPDSTEPAKPGTKTQFPSWLKVLVISFAATFCIGYVGGLHQLDKDFGKEGVPHWNENYWECVQSCIFDAMIIAVPGTLLIFGGYGLWSKLFTKNR